MYSAWIHKSRTYVISPEYSLTDWCWSWNSNTLAMWYKELTHWKILWCWERLKAGEEGDNRGWDGWVLRWLNGHEFEQGSEVGDEQGSLVCCSPWGRKESDMTKRWNWWIQPCCLHILSSQEWILLTCWKKPVVWKWKGQSKHFSCKVFSLHSIWILKPLLRGEYH